MTNREKEAMPSLLAFIAGLLVAVLFVGLLGMMQSQDAKDEALAEQVRACSEYAQSCRIVVTRETAP